MDGVGDAGGQKKRHYLSQILRDEQVLRLRISPRPEERVVDGRPANANGVVGRLTAGGQGGGRTRMRENEETGGGGCGRTRRQEDEEAGGGRCGSRRADMLQTIADCSGLTRRLLQGGSRSEHPCILKKADESQHTC